MRLEEVIIHASMSATPPQWVLTICSHDDLWCLEVIIGCCV